MTSKTGLKSSSKSKPNKAVTIEPVVEEVVQPQITQPSPVPSTFQVASVVDNDSGQQFVMLAVSTPTGRSVFFLESEIAGVVGEALIKLADQTKGSGLIVPPGLTVPTL